MTKKMLLFEFMMINSLLFVAAWPQQLKPIAYILIAIPLTISYMRCRSELLN